MRSEFIAIFRRYLGASPAAFLIIDDASGRFVQFTREGQGVMFDLPNHGLTAEQVKRADKVLVGELGAQTYTIDDAHFSYQLLLEPEPEQLTNLALAVFELVYGAPPRGPLKATIDT